MQAHAGIQIENKQHQCDVVRRYFTLTTHSVRFVKVCRQYESRWKEMVGEAPSAVGNESP